MLTFEAIKNEDIIFVPDRKSEMVTAYLRHHPEYMAVGENEFDAELKLRGLIGDPKGTFLIMNNDDAITIMPKNPESRWLAIDDNNKIISEAMTPKQVISEAYRINKKFTLMFVPRKAKPSKELPFIIPTSFFKKPWRKKPVIFVDLLFYFFILFLVHFSQSLYVFIVSISVTLAYNLKYEFLKRT